MNAEAREEVTFLKGVKEETLPKRVQKCKSEISEMILRGSKNYPGVFRLKKFSMENNQSTCWKIPSQIKTDGKLSDLKAG